MEKKVSRGLENSEEFAAVYEKTKEDHDRSGLIESSNNTICNREQCFGFSYKQNEPIVVLGRFGVARGTRGKVVLERFRESYSRPSAKPTNTKLDSRLYRSNSEQKPDYLVRGIGDF